MVAFGAVGSYCLGRLELVDMDELDGDFFPPTEAGGIRGPDTTIDGKVVAVKASSETTTIMTELGKIYTMGFGQSGT